jgi:hypothetical protein
MDDYKSLIEQAQTYRDMARFEDEHMRRILLGVVQDLEAKARNLLRKSEQSGPQN